MAKTFDDMTKREILNCISDEVDYQTAARDETSKKLLDLEDLKQRIANKKLGPKLRAEFASLVPARN